MNTFHSQGIKLTPFIVIMCAQTCPLVRLHFSTKIKDNYYVIVEAIENWGVEERNKIQSSFDDKETGNFGNS